MAAPCSRRGPLSCCSSVAESDCCVLLLLVGLVYTLHVQSVTVSSGCAASTDSQLHSFIRCASHFATVSEPLLIAFCSAIAKDERGKLFLQRDVFCVCKLYSVTLHLASNTNRCVQWRSHRSDLGEDTTFEHFTRQFS